jgi:hypothetical protein
MKRNEVLSEVVQEREMAAKVPVSIEVSYDTYFKCQHDHITGYAIEPDGSTVAASDTNAERFTLTTRYDSPTNPHPKERWSLSND